MNNLYNVVPITGKNLGCVALKDIKMGTLILQEYPQCKPNKNDLSTLLNSFKQMDKSSQEEYLQLYNRFVELKNLNEKDKKLIQEVQSRLYEEHNTNHKILGMAVETALEIYGIYKTNAFKSYGVCIKASRFEFLKLNEKPQNHQKGL